jgi:hypothetical protein
MPKGAHSRLQLALRYSLRLGLEAVSFAYGTFAYGTQHEIDDCLRALPRNAKKPLEFS